MLEGETILAVIPARGGSKGIPKKNLHPAGGKPLLAWTIEEAGKSRYIDRLILSSENEEIIRVAESYGCEVPFVRPANLAGDEVSAVEPVIHALQVLPGYDYVLLLQPCCPLRSVEDIDGCVEYCVKNAARACVSVVKPDKSPYWMYRLDAEGRLLSLLPIAQKNTQRNDLPDTYLLNGAIYLAQVSWLLTHGTFLTPETLAYPMPKERSLDIDTEMDLDYFEFLLARRKPNSITAD